MSTKLQQLIQANKNPGLAILNAVQEMKTEMREKVQEICEKEMDKMMKEMMSEMEMEIGEKMEKMHSEKSDMGIVEKITKNVLKDIKGEQGIQGEKGEIGEKGDKGIDGKNGIKGENGKDGKDGENGIDGKDGLNGKDGKDGSPDTPNQIADKLNTLEEKVEMKVINGLLKEFDNFKKMLQNISRTRGGGGGGMGNIIAETPSGTVNGVNTVFTLTSFPKTNSLILLWNGQFQRLTSEYTISGKTITFLTAPTAGEVYCWYIRI